MARLTAASLIFVGFAATAAAQPDLRAPEVEKALAEIQPAPLRAHMTFLAHDLLEGRGTATRGYDLAAEYMAAQFEAAGLEPGAAGGWLQRVPLRRAELDPERSGVELVAKDGTRSAMRVFEDVLMSADLRGPTDVEGPVVFVGYGVTAPEFEHDDYAGVDARGKIVAFFGDAPATFPTAERAHYSSNSEKARNAAAHGAVGILRLRAASDEKIYTWPMAIASSRGRASYAWLDGTQPFDLHETIRGTAALGIPASERLFAGAGISYADAVAKKKPAVLATRARIFRQGRTTDVHSPNVVGLLRGSDPVLRDEYVVFSAHLDHLGIGPAVAGDTIYNGAVDDASGNAALIEIARRFASLPQRPRRSILFLAVTGEEYGLLGSSYFANKPTVPIESIAANLNIDGMTVWPTAALVGRGAEHSTISRALEAAAARLRLKTAPDPMPEQVFFVRSDQYSFIKRGVPSLFLGSTYTDAGTPMLQGYMRERYHRPADDMSQPIDMDAAVQFTRAYFLVGYHVAQDDARPRWNRDSFFGTRFGTASTKAR